MMNRQVKPYGTSPESKKAQVRRMFDSISPKYDLLNRLLSAGIDQRWRKRLIKLMKRQQPEHILDIATGTADLPVLQAKALPSARITGLDISEGMLEVGRKKIKKAGLENRVELTPGDAENLPFDNASYDAVTVAFGVRNFEDLEKGIREMARVLRPGGQMYILEFSQPEKTPFKQLYGFYSRRILPFIGKLVSGDASAYTYLPESIAVFPYGEQMKNIILKNGFSEAEIYPLTFGIATIYVAKK